MNTPASSYHCVLLFNTSTKSSFSSGETKWQLKTALSCVLLSHFQIIRDKNESFDYFICGFESQCYFKITEPLVGYTIE